jgi:hypothetical protein
MGAWGGLVCNGRESWWVCEGDVYIHERQEGVPLVSTPATTRPRSLTPFTPVAVSLTPRSAIEASLFQGLQGTRVTEKVRPDLWIIRCTGYSIFA